MPIVDGKYELRMSTTFASAEEGTQAIEDKLRKSRRVRINNIPMRLLHELKPLLEGKDVKIILPIGEKPGEDIKKLGDVATTKARIYVEYKGKEASTGSVSFSDVMFNIVWLGDELLQIATMEYGKCVKCLLDTFDASWRYSQKW